MSSSGTPERLTGVNWFGFETANRVAHGLWVRDYRSMLRQIRELGFNVIRLPWSNALLEEGAAASGITFSGADPYDGRSPLNQPLLGKTPLQMMDLVVGEAGRLGLKIFLDNHSRKPDDYAKEDLWYLPDFPEQRWIEDWVTMARRYRNNPTVIGFDLNNEPHGRSSWGGSSETDWAAAAERAGAAIQAVHPDALIIVEGVQQHDNHLYWWGGNLRGVRSRPVSGINPAKLVYSPHDYSPEVFAQPWFSDSSFPDNLAPLWDETWGYIQKEHLGCLLLGEFGIKSRTSVGGKPYVWFQRLTAYLGTSISWTYWSWNPNSSDTAGILQDDWTCVNQWKMDVLRPYLAPQFQPAP